jgi:hypothetical protein
MDYTAWRFWFDVMQVAATVFIAIYVWWTNREKVNARRFAALEKEVANRVTSEALTAIRRERDRQCEKHQERTDKAEEDITRVALEVRHLPSHKDIAALSSNISELHGSIQHFAGRLEGLGRAVDLVNEFLISQGGKK